uniref:Uncharacterized protein n=1 Tax=viral metagenome TaxID=1070528 RepID=A0A6M3K4N7_9ZZZZ
MAKTLSPLIIDAITRQDIKYKRTLTIGNYDISNYLIDSNRSFSREFGSAQATFRLNNGDGRFGDGGVNEINIGDIVSYSVYYGVDLTQEFKKFYGFVNQRSISKSSNERNINIICLDYISCTQFMDIDLEVEGTKVLVENETLTPNYLASPNDTLAQVFDFANNGLADNPLPIILIKNKGTAEEDPQYDGFEISYNEGQLKLGFPLSAKDNYDIIATSYYFYTRGIYTEDVLKEILCEPDGYGTYLFKETTEQAFIDNHLIETFQNAEGAVSDTMIPNYTASNIIIETTLTTDVILGATSISVVSTSGFPTVGSGTINGDTFSWTGKTGTTLTGIPSTGSYSLKAHKNTSYVEYSETYSAGRVWYLRYSNLISDHGAGDFTIPGGTFNYLDKRSGRIILDSAITTTSIVKCNANYSFYTLQSNGIQINRISFRSREMENRFEAIKKLKEYCPPNYVIYTRGDNKIWAKLMSQRSVADFTLQLVTSLNYLEDEDLYTRVIFYGKNINPTNLMLGGGCDFVGTGETYKAIASNSELSLLREEGNFYIYGSPVSGIGEITANLIKPKVYVNSVEIDNTSHRIVSQAVVLETVTKTETTQKSGGK